MLSNITDGGELTPGSTTPGRGSRVAAARRRTQTEDCLFPGPGPSSPPCSPPAPGSPQTAGSPSRAPGRSLWRRVHRGEEATSRGLI